MDIKISDELKSDLPQTLRGKVLAATPVVMAVVSTLLAGLSSSEMTRAQYDRSLAAQQQSKAGDQWGYFQAKRLRSALQRTTGDLLSSTAEVHAIDAGSLRRDITQLPADTVGRADLLTLLDSDTGRAAMAALTSGELAVPEARSTLDGPINTALEAIEQPRSDAEIASRVADLKSASIDAALRDARERVRSYDARITPLSQAIDRIDQLLAKLARQPASATSPVNAGTYRNFTALRLEFAAHRYDAEARLNQTLALLYELEVRRSNLSAERHHLRSQQFFYGMLAAQTAVIISTFAMAARQRNLLWSLAAAAGIGAVAFAAYVYLAF